MRGPELYGQISCWTVKQTRVSTCSFYPQELLLHLSPGSLWNGVCAPRLRARTRLCTLTQVHLLLNETQRCCQGLWGISELQCLFQSLLSPPLETKNHTSPLQSKRLTLRYCAPLICLIKILALSFRSPSLRDTWRVRGTTISPRSVGMEGCRYCGMQCGLPMASHRMDGLKQRGWRE